MRDVEWSTDTLYYFLITMIVQCNLAFAAVRNIALQMFVWCLRPKTYLPSESTVQRMVVQRANEILASPDVLLKDVMPNQKVNLSLDMWSDRWSNSYLAINCWWIDKDWVLRDALIGFEPSNESHTGHVLASKVEEVLDRFCLKGRVMTLTTDNAKPNETMTNILRGGTAKGKGKKKKQISIEELIDQSSASKQAMDDLISALDQRWKDSKIIQVPCFSHILQLALGNLLGILHIRPTNEQFQLAWDHKGDIKELDWIMKVCRNKGDFMIPLIIKITDT